MPREAFLHLNFNFIIFSSCPEPLFSFSNGSFANGFYCTQPDSVTCYKFEQIDEKFAKFAKRFIIDTGSVDESAIGKWQKMNRTMEAEIVERLANGSFLEDLDGIWVPIEECDEEVEIIFY